MINNIAILIFLLSFKTCALALTNVHSDIVELHLLTATRQNNNNSLN
jgi:hypothetical protein